MARGTNLYSMLEQVPVTVELAIYGYFGVVAAIGLSLHARLLRRHRRDEPPDDGIDL